MEKFSITRRGYNPEEVNRFLDQVIKKFEDLVKESTEDKKHIAELEKQKQELINNPEIANLRLENKGLKEKVEYFGRIEDTMNKAIFMAQKTSDQMRVSAHEQSEVIISEAKKNASRIINEALLKAEQAEDEAETLRRNINVFKRRLKSIVEAQLETINDIEKVEL